MSPVFEGQPVAPDGRLAIVVSRFNRSVTSRLLEGALQTLRDAGVEEESIDVAWIPGAWELPVVASRLAASGEYRALICLGAVIRGETTHDEQINRAVSLSLQQTATLHGRPVLFGLLTCATLEQALQRAGGAAGNKGSDCAEAALEMIDLLDRLPGGETA